MERVLIKVDKNGTKYYADYTCPRCGGQGGSNAWIYTGWTCYECGGSGRTAHPQIEKEYTPEYRAKLDAQREKRAAKKRAEEIEEFLTHKSEHLEKLGFNADGKVYCITGETYSIKEELKSEGARWMDRLGCWCFREPSETRETVEIDYTEVIEDEFGYWFGKPCFNWKENAKDIVKAKMPKKEIVSEYIAQIGDKVDVELKLKRTFSFESSFGYRTTTVYIFNFEDANGNVVVWKTSSWYGKEGQTYHIKGTVKELSEYKGVKQTILTRCKEVA